MTSEIVKKEEVSPILFSPEGIKKAIEQTLAIMEAFETAKKKILSDKDIAIIHNNPYIRKTGWVKFATFFGIDVQPVEILRIDMPNNNYAIQITAEGRFKLLNRVERDIGVAEYTELLNRAKGKNSIPPTYHNIETLAYARAYNRVVSKLVGGGQVSAEEVSPEEIFVREIQESPPEPTPQQNQPQQANPQPQNPQPQQQQQPKPQQQTQQTLQNMITPSQKNYIKQLLSEIGGEIDEDKLNSMTRAEASELIKRLKEGE